jgi:putative phage-type endonuclease
MAVTIIPHSPEWHAFRCGSLGGSDIAAALGRTQRGAWSSTRADVATRLLIERLTGKPVQTWVSRPMQQGIEREPEARRAYAFRTDNDVEECDPIRHPAIAGAHASPDGLVGEEGMVQFKCPQEKAHIALLMGGAVPPEYVMQCQWEMACAGRQRVWSDFTSYQPDFPASMQLVVRRIERDPEYIAEMEEQAALFLEEVEMQFRALKTAYDPMGAFQDAHQFLVAAE